VLSRGRSVESFDRNNGGHWIELKAMRGLGAIDFNNVGMLGIIF
jgi:hypothetical protein